MDRALNRKIRQVRVRWSVNRLLAESARVLAGMGLLSAMLLLADRLLGVLLWSRPAMGWIALGALAILLYRWIPLIPSRLQISLHIDHHLHLRERFSSLVVLEQMDDAFARAACVEAGRYLTDVEPARRFPLRFTRSWFVALGLWLLMGLLYFFLPAFDLLGRQEQERQRLAQRQQWKTVENEIRDTTAAVKQIAERLNEPLLNEVLADINLPPTAPTPELAQRQTIRRLGDLADRLRQSQSRSANQALDVLQQALKQLRPAAGDLSRQLQLALARGQFQQASQLLRDLEKMLRQGNLSQTQQEDLARQMNDLAGQMKQLASERSALAEALEKLGLDKGLSKLDRQQLQRTLQQKGVAPAQIQELLQQQAASQMAQDRLGALSEACAGAGAGGGLIAEGLAAALSQVDELAALQQENQLSDAALAAIDQAIGALGQCMGAGGAGKKGPFQPGDSQSFSRGSGGPGRGWGEVDSDTAGDFNTKKTRLENAGQGGPTIASWYFQGAQSSGETQRSWQEVLQASREQAAEAIEENRIPGKYHDSVKQYFGDLEDAGDKP